MRSLSKYALKICQDNEVRARLYLRGKSKRVLPWAWGLGHEGVEHESMWM